MVNNPIPIILVLAVISRRSSLSLPSPGALSTLELEAFLDNARTCINTIDRLNGIAHSGLGNLGGLGSLGGLAALTGGGSGSGSSGSSSGSGGGGGLPDMKKIMEIVENLPL